MFGLFIMILISQLQIAVPQAQRVNLNVHGSIEGIVTAPDSQEGIPEVEVTLTFSGGPAGVSSPLNRTTDATGKFVFADVEGGRYTLKAKREGYFAIGVFDDIATPEATASVTVIQDAPKMQVSMVLVQGGIITGFIRDGQGRAAAGVSVEALRVRYQDGHPTYAVVNPSSRAGSSATAFRTDDRGEYRLFWLPPGEYFIRTDNSNSGGAARSDARTVPQATFYPGTTDGTRAIPVRVNAGQETGGIDFSVEYAPGFTVSGKVTVAVPAAQASFRSLRSFYVVPQSAGPTDRVPLATNSRSTPNSTQTEFDFELRGIVPGLYDLMPLFDGGSRGAGLPPNYYSVRIPVEVIDRDVTGLRGEIHPYPDLELQVIMKGSASPGEVAATPTFRVQLRPEQPLGLVAPSWTLSQQSVDGLIVFQNLFPSAYKIQITPVPFGYYLSDIRQGPVSLYSDAVVNVTSSEAPPLEVTLSAGGGRIRGLVMDRLGQPAAARVALVPERSLRSNGMLYKRAVSNAQTGQFELYDIAPGEYKLFAWTSFPSGAEENAEIIAKYETRGRLVTVESGAAIADVVLEVVDP